jgi:polysaccharide pyruvyl transferase WcaK-like protein
MSNFGRVCTGRFHGAILASMLKIPFTAYPSNTHKIIGMMEDMGLEDLYFRTREEALFNMPLKFSDKQWTNLNKYTSDASVKIEESFNWIDDLF